MRSLNLLFEQFLTGNGAQLLSPAIVSQVNFIRKSLEDDSDEVIAALLEQLRNSLTEEIDSVLFFAVPHSRAPAYVDPQAWFGEATVAKFPIMSGDVWAACQCYALGQWTATVFHAMRILEHGLRAMARRYKVQQPPAKQWDTLINELEKAIKDIGNQPTKTTAERAKRAKRLQEASSAARQFRFFKDAVRNHVAHAHVAYDEQAATRILYSVRDFMGALAEPRTKKS